MLLSHPVAWQPMKVIGGRFTLLGRLAFGGMAEVWLARQSGPQGFNRMVVVKRVLEARSLEEEIVRMFVEEARLGGQLSHPNIVQTVDFGEDEGVPFIVMEYLFGENLGQIIKTCRQKGLELPMPVAVRIISDAALGLSSAHELKGMDGKPLHIVHRDVSPQNLLVTYDGVVKVLDFGIAKSAGRASYTDQTQVRGRVTYMSPEQMSAEPLDQRADVFALGVVLWEAVTGQPMYQKVEQADAVVVMKLLSTDEPVPSAHKTNPAVPVELDLILAHALEKNRERRYASSSLFHSALEAFLRRQPEPPSQARLAELMVELFADRQQERTQVLQRLSTGATPKWTPSVVDALAPPTLTTDPKLDPQKGLETSESPAQRRGRIVQRSALAGLGLLLLAVLSVGYGLTRAPQSAASPPPLAAPATPATPPPAHAEVTPEPSAPTPAPKVAAPEPVVLAAALPDERPAEPQKTRGTKPTGRLRLDTEPWTTVFLNGRKLGETPLVDVRVPAGQLQLTLVNEEQKIRTVIVVDVTAGETTAKRLQF